MRPYRLYRHPVLPHLLESFSYFILTVYIQTDITISLFSFRRKIFINYQKIKINSQLLNIDLKQ